MRTSTVLSVLGASALAVAQRPSNESICDYYTTALLKNNTAANQYTLLNLVVNTAVIGNYTKPNVGIAVPGILASNATYNGTAVNLVQYFDGALASANRGGSAGVAVNFLDGGGAAPIMMNMPANSTSSNQYSLLTHLYEYFGFLLGCSEYGVGAFPAYSGFNSMYQVHKFMDLDEYEISYFIEQVGLSAASFGVATADVEAVGMALNELFGYRCAGNATIIPAQAAALQSICIADDCPIAANSTCAAYANTTMPVAAASANSTIAAGTGSVTAGATGTSASMLAMQSTGAGSKHAVEVLGAMGAAALAFAL